MKVLDHLILTGMATYKIMMSLDSFLDICKYALNETAPLKQKYIRANNSPFMNKTISREIMKGTRMRKKFLRERTEANRKAGNIQKNYCFTDTKNQKRLL